MKLITTHCDYTDLILIRTRNSQIIIDHQFNSLENLHLVLISLTVVRVPLLTVPAFETGLVLSTTVRGRCGGGGGDCDLVVGLAGGGGGDLPATEDFFGNVNGGFFDIGGGGGFFPIGGAVFLAGSGGVEEEFEYRVGARARRCGTLSATSLFDFVDAEECNRDGSAGGGAAKTAASDLPVFRDGSVGGAPPCLPGTGGNAKPIFIMIYD